jgi:exodeoxyribonuclease VII large subunit
MEPAGLGTLYLAFEALKKSLSEKGWFEPEIKKPIPHYPQSIGIVTSKTGAAIQDILKILSRRAPYAGIIVKHTAVQGTGSAEQIAEAVPQFAESGGVLLPRAGGRGDHPGSVQRLRRCGTG